jgi:Protein similar to CwfJ C-terminus 2
VQEVVGGMLDLEPSLWRKPHQERFDDQRKKVLKFAEMWKAYDWTQRLKKTNDDDIDMRDTEEEKDKEPSSPLLDAATSSS